MKLKLDENMPLSLVGALTLLGHDTDTVLQEGLTGQADPSVWDAAQRSGRFFVTQDLDFSDSRRFIPGTHQGILLVRLRDPQRAAITECVRAVFASEDVATWQGCIVVVSERKVRVQRPQPDVTGE